MVCRVSADPEPLSGDGGVQVLNGLRVALFTKIIVISISAQKAFHPQAPVKQLLRKISIVPLQKLHLLEAETVAFPAYATYIS